MSSDSYEGDPRDSPSPGEQEQQNESNNSRQQGHLPDTVGGNNPSQSQSTSLSSQQQASPFLSQDLVAFLQQLIAAQSLLGQNVTPPPQPFINHLPAPRLNQSPAELQQFVAALVEFNQILSALLQTAQLFQHSIQAGQNSQEAQNLVTIVSTLEQRRITLLSQLQEHARIILSNGEVISNPFLSVMNPQLQRQAPNQPTTNQQPIERSYQNNISQLPLAIPIAQHPLMAARLEPAVPTAPLHQITASTSTEGVAAAAIATAAPPEDVNAELFSRRFLQDPFPVKLYQILNEAEKDGHDDIIHWSQDGASFQVVNPSRFMSEISQQHFQFQTYESFVRQLHYYGFQKLDWGSAAMGVYQHEMFRRGKLSTVWEMRRKLRPKKGKSKGSSDKK